MTSDGARREVYSLLSVLFAGVISALLAVLLLVFYYGPTGKYQAGALLLDPIVMRDLSFIDAEMGKERLAFKGVYFSYYDEKLEHWLEVPVSMADYEVLYRALQSDLSLLELTDGIRNQFHVAQISTLVVRVYPKIAGGNARDLLELSISPLGNFYRIRLRSSGTKDAYAYFERKNLLELLKPLMKH